MDTERSTVHLVKEIFPTSLVGREVIHRQVPLNLKGQKASVYIQKLGKNPWNDHDVVIDLKESASKVTHKPNTQGCTMTFQELEGIQHKLEKVPGDTTLSKIELM